MEFNEIIEICKRNPNKTGTEIARIFRQLQKNDPNEPIARLRDEIDGGSSLLEVVGILEDGIVYSSGGWKFLKNCSFEELLNAMSFLKHVREMPYEVTRHKSREIGAMIFNADKTRMLISDYFRKYKVESLIRLFAKSVESKFDASRIVFDDFVECQAVQGESKYKEHELVAVHCVIKSGDYGPYADCASESFGDCSTPLFPGEASGFVMRNLRAFCEEKVVYYGNVCGEENEKAGNLRLSLEDGKLIVPLLSRERVDNLRKNLVLFVASLLAN
jgi:hypothetical protein